MRAIGILAALLAILLWTFGNTIVELENYRAANSSGMCHVAGTRVRRTGAHPARPMSRGSGHANQPDPASAARASGSLIAPGLISWIDAKNRDRWVLRRERDL